MLSWCICFRFLGLKNLFGLDFELGEDYLYDAAVVHPFLRSMARIRRALMVISHWTTHLDNIVIHTTLLLLLPKPKQDVVGLSYIATLVKSVPVFLQHPLFNR